MVKLKRLLMLSSSILVLLSSCKVKIVDVVPVFEYDDVSINTVHDVVSVSFVSDNVGFAGCHTEPENSFNPYQNAYYKTINGGKSWEPIVFPGSNDKEVHGVCFITDQTGVIMNDNDVYLTEDGGSSWVTVATSALCVGKDDNNQLYLAETNGPLYVVIKKFNTQSHGFSSIGSMYVEESTRTGGVVDGNHLYIFTASDVYNDYVHGFDLATYQEDNLAVDNLIASEVPTDIYYDGVNYAMTTLEGLVVHSGENGYNEKYDYHLYDYHAVDFSGDYFVSVGENTIASDITGSWREVFDIDRNGFNAIFYCVEFYNNTSCVVGGQSGLILKGSLE